MNNPRISIIVPCYNGEKYLRETLDCLQKQTIEDWECIVVNDGSTDRSLDIIKEYATKDSRYKFIDKINEGPAVARNTAIAASKGKYILPLDADDLIDPTYSEKAISYFEKNPYTKLVYCLCEFFGEETGVWKLPPYNFDELMWHNMIFCSAVFKRVDFFITAGYNANMRKGMEDWDFWLSFLTKDDIVYQIPEPLFYYRRLNNTRSTQSDSIYEEVCSNIVYNHLPLYKKYLGKVIVHDSTVLYYKSAIKDIKNSKTYMVGKAILHPFTTIKELFFQKCQ